MIRRVGASLGLSTLLILITMVGQVATVPILLSRWGAEIYGEWLTLTNLVANLSYLNLGVQTYVLNILISHYVRGEIREGTRVLHGALRLYMPLCGVGLAITFGLATWSSLLELLHISATGTTDSRLIVIIQGILAIYAILDGLLMTLLIVAKQYPRRLVYSLVERIVLLGAPVVVALLGGFPLAVALTIGILMGGIAVIQVRDVKRRSPYSLGVSDTSWREAFALIGPSLVFLGVTISSLLLSSGMILVISVFSGPAAVALYATTLMMTNFVRVIINQGMNVLWPEITATSVATAAPEQLIQWHRLTIKVVTGFALIVAIGIGLLGTAVLAFWTGKGISVDPWLNSLLAVYLVVHAPALTSRTFGLATNRQGELLQADITGAIIALVLAIFLLPPLGLSGVALALIVGQAVNTVWIAKSASQWTSDNWFALLVDCGLRGLLAVLSIAVTSLGIWYILSGFTARILGFAIATILFAYVAWKTWLTKQERGLITRMLGEAARYLSRASIV